MRKRRPTADPNMPAQKTSTTGLLTWFLTGMGLAIVSFIWLFIQYRSVLVAVVGGYYWGIEFVIAFVVGCAYFAQFVLPIDSFSGWYQAFRLLLDHYFEVAKGAPPPTNAPDYFPPSFKKIGAGLMPSQEALSIVANGKFSRAAGPGFVRIEKGEKIAQVIDLRKQKRDTPLQAVTKDGIQVETAVNAVFQIRQKPHPTSAEAPGSIFPYRNDLGHSQPYYYHPDAIFRLTYASGLLSYNSATKKHFISWAHRISPHIAALLRTRIALHPYERLDVATAGQLNGQMPLNKFATEMRDDFAKEFAEILFYRNSDDCPLQLWQVRVNRLKADPAIMAQRITNWRQKWQNHILDMQASNQVKQIHATSEQHNRVQMESMMRTLTDIKKIKHTKDADVSIIAISQILSMIEMSLSSHQSVQNGLSLSQLLDLLIQLPTWLYPPVGESVDSKAGETPSTP